MRELKVHIQHLMLREFKSHTDTTETAKKISSVIINYSKMIFKSFIQAIHHKEMNSD